MFLAFHTFIAFIEYPWVDTNSLEFVEYNMLHTCDPVSIFLMHLDSAVFHIRMCLSVLPPPVAKIEVWWGDHAKALTAAVCYVKRWYMRLFLISNKEIMLSFPPEAIIFPSNDHLTPQISCLCGSHLWTIYLLRWSHILMAQSLPPLTIKFEPWVSIAPILAQCDLFLHSSFLASTSITLIFPVYSPIINLFVFAPPVCCHLIELINPYTNFYV